ncbi:hypothetical protein AVEN_81839-1 [Araneus ventricosus]|uniref:Pre-C2HC domain-containing protein n=1 Tax=Araneus ventricosus TaxID=182803 RepID=A0A4Y2IG95_ARAVE|nr:hypothetical protein AVEN_81839-1 [Araneus ventricosus]
MAFRKYYVERIVKSIIECVEEIALEDIHFHYGLLAKKDPTEISTNWMIKLQTLAANKYGENTIPEINLFMDIEKLDIEKIQYYVISPTEKKPIKVVIKGLPIDYSTEEIKTSLTKLNFRVDKVNQLKKFKDKKPLNIFQVHLLKSEDVQDIYKLTTMDYHIIYVEKYERKTIGQCLCCQKFSHHSSECKMDVRCVICAEAHDSRACSMKKKENFIRKSANCNEPHTTSFRDCPKFPKLKKTVPGKSYASTLKESNKKTITAEKPPEVNNEQKKTSLLT